MKKLLLVTTALTALLAGPAHADPTGGIATVVALTANGVGLGAAVWAVYGGAISAFGTMIGSSLLQGALAKTRENRPKANVSMMVEVGDDTSLAFVVGDFATPGKRKYMGSWGPNTRFIAEVIEVSCLPQGLRRVWIDDALANIDYAGGEVWLGGVHNVGYAIRNYDSKGAPRVWIKYYDGTQTAADPYLVGEFGNDANYPWTSEFIGTGKSYAVITSCYDKDTLTSYPKFLFEPEPLPVYDPRLDSTAGGLGPHRWGVRSTYSPSRNPAVLAYNIARGIYLGEEWVFGGRNMPAWRLPFDEWVAAMNACDDLVDLDDGTREPAFRAGAEITVDMEPLAVMEELGRAANLRFAEVGGMLKPVVGLPGAAVLGITDDDIIITEGQSFQPFYPASETFNAIGATYPEPGEKWTSKDAPEYVDATATAEDDGRYLPTSVSYAAAPFAQQVQRLMRAQMLDYRRMRRHTFQLPPDAYGLEPLVDMISWTSARNGYVDKAFLVESVTKAAGMNVLVTVRECDPGDYDWSSEWQQPVVIVPPTNVIPFTQAVPGFAAVAAVIDGEGGQKRPAIQVSCDGDQSGVTNIRIQMRRAGETDPQMDVTRPYGDPLDGSTKAWQIVDVLPATPYQVRAQLITELAGIPDWSGWITVTTDDIRLSQTDMTAELRAALDTLNDWISNGIPGIEGGISNLSALFRRLADDQRAIAAEVIEGSAQRLIAEQKVRQYLATAEYTLGARVDVTDEQVRVVSAAVTALQSVIPQLATATALQALSTVVTQQGTTLSAVAASVTVLQAQIDGKADAGALSSLEATVTEQAGVVSSQGTAITGLTSGLAATNTNVTAAQNAAQAASDLAGGKGKVMYQSTAPAVADRLAQNLWIDTTGGANTPKRWNGSAWVAVTDKVATDAAQAAADALAVANTKASASAVNTLTTRVTQAELDIEAGANAQTALQAVVGMFEASGLFRVEVLATPSGALSRIGLKAAATNGESAGARMAALFLEAIAGGASRVVVQADTFAIADGTGRIFPFYADASGVYISSAFIKEASIDTLKIAGNAVTVPVSAAGTTKTGGAGWQDLVSVTIDLPANAAAVLQWSVEQSYTDAAYWGVRLMRGSTVLKSRSNMLAYADWPAGIFMDTWSGSGPRTYTLSWNGGSGSISALGTLAVLGAKR